MRQLDSLSKLSTAQLTTTYLASMMNMPFHLCSENKVADGVEDDMIIDLSSSPPVPVKTGSGNANIVRQESTFSNRSWCEDDSCAVDNSNHAWDMQ